MRYRRLGSTDIEVSVLGLGTVKLGRTAAVNYPQPFELPDDRAAARLLDAARDLGINLLDTAPAYGASESRLGGLLRDQRNDWILSSKVGETFENGESRFDFSPEAVRRSIKSSLQRLHTDRLDIALIHSNGDDLEILDTLGTLDALKDLKERGWLRSIGISHKTADGGRRAIALGCDLLMTTLNLVQRDQAPVIAEAGEAGCGVLVKKALAGGHSGPESLRYAVNQPGVTSVVVGTINPVHLRADAAAIESQPAAT